MLSEKDNTTKAVHSTYDTGLYNDAGAGMMRRVPHSPRRFRPSYPRIWAHSPLTVHSFGPINNIHQHLCGLHIYSHTPSRAVRAHHYCSHLRPDLHQCVIYDSDQPGARLIGVEYVIPEEAFVKLPEDEKKYWHSHKYEVQSGMLILGTKQLVPNAVSDIAEQPAMLELHKTYGKTIHTWASDEHPDFPLGPPHSMLAYTADGQLDQALLDKRDKDMGVSTSAKRAARDGYLPKEAKDRPPADGCDIWLQGRKGRWVWVEDKD